MSVQLRSMAHYRTVRVSFIMVIGVVLCHIIIGSGPQWHIIITAVQINCWPIAGINFISRSVPVHCIPGVSCMPSWTRVYVVGVVWANELSNQPWLVAIEWKSSYCCLAHFSFHEFYQTVVVWFLFRFLDDEYQRAHDNPNEWATMNRVQLQQVAPFYTPPFKTAEVVRAYHGQGSDSVKRELPWIGGREREAREWISGGKDRQTIRDDDNGGQIQLKWKACTELQSVARQFSTRKVLSRGSNRVQ